MPFNYAYRYVYILYTFIGFPVGGILTCNSKMFYISLLHCQAGSLSHCHSLWSSSSYYWHISFFFFDKSKRWSCLKLKLWWRWWTWYLSIWCLFRFWVAFDLKGQYNHLVLFNLFWLMRRLYRLKMVGASMNLCDNIKLNPTMCILLLRESERLPAQSTHNLRHFKSLYYLNCWQHA